MVMKHWIGLIVVLSLIASNASAEVKLPALFTDHMVVQRDQPLKIWGWADPSESVVVSIGNSKATAVADAAGKWGPFEAGPAICVARPASR